MLQTLAADSRAGRTTRAGLILERLAAACLIALAPVMAIAHRSSPLMVTLAAAFALLAAAANGELAPLGRRLTVALVSPLGGAILAFLVWAGLSVLWSVDVRTSLQALGEFGLPIAATWLLAAKRPRPSGSAALWLAGSLILAAAIILADLATGLAMRRALGMRAAAFVLNRPSLTLLVLVPVSIALLWRERRGWVAALTAAMVAAAILRCESGAARLGLVALVLVAGVTLLSRRVALWLVGAALLGALALAPVMGELANDLVPPAAFRALAGAHARARADIWLSFGAALRRHPILGEGFGASAHLETAPVAGEVAPDFATYLAVGHPHDAALQIWVELGAVGAGLAGALAACLLWTCRRFARADLVVALSLVTAVLADSLVGQGAWQGWWPASIGASIIWFGLAGGGKSEDIHGHI